LSGKCLKAKSRPPDRRFSREAATRPASSVSRCTRRPAPACRQSRAAELTARRAGWLAGQDSTGAPVFRAVVRRTRQRMGRAAPSVPLPAHAAAGAGRRRAASPRSRHTRVRRGIIRPPRRRSLVEAPVASRRQRRSCQKLTIAAKSSGLSDAPPTSAPSRSGCAIRPRMLSGFTLPP